MQSISSPSLGCLAESVWHTGAMYLTLSGKEVYRSVGWLGWLVIFVLTLLYSWAYFTVLALGAWSMNCFLLPFCFFSFITVLTLFFLKLFFKTWSFCSFGANTRCLAHRVNIQSITTRTIFFHYIPADPEYSIIAGEQENNLKICFVNITKVFKKYLYRSIKYGKIQKVGDK